MVRMAKQTLSRELRRVGYRRLPVKCPELNPVENFWQFIRSN